MNKYCICPNCGRGIGLTKHKIIYRHYKGKTSKLCSKSNKKLYK